MRAFGIENIIFETAGSSAPGALVSLPGIINPQEFRDAVLAQKDKLISSHTAGASAYRQLNSSPGNELTETNELLREIRDLIKDQADN